MVVGAEAADAGEVEEEIGEGGGGADALGMWEDLVQP